jgi:hypothetical protein
MEIFLDCDTQIHTCGFQFGEPISSNARLFVGTNTGLIFEEYSDGIAGEAAFAPPDMEIQYAHYFPDIPGGDEMDGWVFQPIWFLVESEDADWTLSITAGDEQAWQQEFEDWPVSQLTVGASEKIVLDSSVTPNWRYTYVPKTVHFFNPDRIVGRGITWTITTPVLNNTFHFRGFGGEYRQGKATRAIAKILE